ncbi:MAG: HoxN/HupN/NixA family nickel/cobalt transporter [Aeromicrobium sp.]
MKRSLLGMTAVVAALHVIGLGGLLAFMGPHALTVGAGLLAYSLGMRHAIDPDHVAAIDNVTRSLNARAPGSGQRPWSVGFWFSLGHASVVFGLVALLAFGVRGLAGELTEHGSALHTLTGVIGPTVSGVFLWVLGLANVAAIVGIARVFRAMRSGQFSDAELEHHLGSRGFLARVLRPVTRAVRKPWHMYPVGFLFGLGFDTATEVGLLALAGGAATQVLPFHAVLVLPVLFAAGMSLLDAVDGVATNAAYEWALARPLRRVFYSLAVSSVSVGLALVIGTIELLDAAGVATIRLDDLGIIVVGTLVLAWTTAAAIWRFGRMEARWARS